MLSSAHLKFFFKVKNTRKFSSLVALKGKFGFRSIVGSFKDYFLNQSHGPLRSHFSANGLRW